jgi:exodeoxyribonuclease-3
MKLISWNIDSLNAALTGNSPRAALSQAVLQKLATIDFDILALQETKLPEKGPSPKHLEILQHYFPNKIVVWRNSQEPARKGYAGVMFIYSQHLQPNITQPIIDAPSTMDIEGRILTLEFDNFFVTQVYTPNAGDELKRLPDRQLWDIKYQEYIQELLNQKPVIACGDYNVAHKEIDLKNPKTNHFSPGFTDEERAGFTNLLNVGLIDTFRHINGDIPDVYSWWGQRIKSSKINNSGWRIDYWLTSSHFKDKIIQSCMIDSGERQDHTPILLELDM